RMAIGTVGILFPQRWKAPYPRVFDTGLYWLQLKWSLRPASVAVHLPRAPELAREPQRMGAWSA
ncbi:MAG: hypothetical protein KFH98_16625, partial [Gemmatimonadetes bacterium]|nr:hypothetical protein [Gemmatimonadota bacterium]